MQFYFWDLLLFIVIYCSGLKLLWNDETGSFYKTAILLLVFVAFYRIPNEKTIKDTKTKNKSSRKKISS